MNITVAVSGGMDSLYALLKLKEEGHRVRAVHALLAANDPDAADPVPGLERLCADLGVEFLVIDLRDAFEELVVAPFLKEYAAARTPNPCARCNRSIKFGLILEGMAATAAEPEREYYATGHYARLDEHSVYGKTLRAGTDKAKDQSYFLSLTPASALVRCVFPLAGTTKPENRAWLAARGFEPPLAGESQEICFVPGDDYRAFLAGRGVRLSGPGPVRLRLHDGGERRIGTHQGLWRYTEGQRKGLGIAWSEPLYVLERNRADNSLVVGPKDFSCTASCQAGDVNLMVPPELWPAELYVRTRYRQRPEAAAVVYDGSRLAVRFAQPQPISAPGQVLAVYDGDGYVLAGGILI